MKRQNISKSTPIITDALNSPLPDPALILLAIFLLNICLTFSTAHASDDAVFDEKQIVRNAIMLSRETGFVQIPQMTGHTPLKIITDHMDALAQYTSGEVRIALPYKKIKREYTVLSSNIPKDNRPSLDQYATILTYLSLANESAHYDQDTSGSLADFYKFIEQGNTDAACTLYAFQQHISDIYMLGAAVALDQHFTTADQPKPRYAVRIALEKINLKDVFSPYETALLTKDKILENELYDRMFRIRQADNIKSLDFCAHSKRTRLSATILQRASGALDFTPSSWRSPSPLLRQPAYNN